MVTAIRALFALLGLAVAAQRAEASSMPVAFTRTLEQAVVSDRLPDLLVAPPSSAEPGANGDYDILLEDSAASDDDAPGVIDALLARDDIGWDEGRID